MTIAHYVVGARSRLWRRIEDRYPDILKSVTPVGHADAASLAFNARDTVIIMSYAPSYAGNIALFDMLKARGAKNVIYLSTATANIADLIGCYRYPRIKRHAERDAVRILGARIVRIGLVYEEQDELPSGPIACTNLDTVRALLHGELLLADNTSPVALYEVLIRSFGSDLEGRAYKVYSRIHQFCSPFPCLTRPFDALIRLAGWRWYGYLFLSNQLCASTTSS